MKSKMCSRGALLGSGTLRNIRCSCEKLMFVTTFLTQEVRSSVTTQDIDIVLRERLPFLTESVTRWHNGGIV